MGLLILRAQYKGTNLHLRSQAAGERQQLSSWKGQQPHVLSAGLRAKTSNLLWDVQEGEAIRMSRKECFVKTG